MERHGMDIKPFAESVFFSVSIFVVGHLLKRKLPRKNIKEIGRRSAAGTERGKVYEKDAKSFKKYEETSFSSF